MQTYCWGASSDARLGAEGEGFVQPKLADGTQLWQVASHGASDSTCALAADSSIVCWGKNDFAQCGVEESATSPPTEIAVAGLAIKATSLAIGGATGCILRPSSVGLMLACWGRNDRCELGTSEAPCTPSFLSTPSSGAAHGSLIDVTSLALGEAHGCVVGPSSDPIVSCWGANDVGQASAGEEIVSPPEQVLFEGEPLAAVAVTAGNAFSCAVTTDKRAVCWGDNTVGAVADGDHVAPLVPTEAFPGIEVERLAAGSNVLCALETSGRVRCRGAGDKGQLGRGSVVQDGSSGEVLDLSNVVDIAVGGAHACAIVALPSGERTLRCWGDNSYGQVDPSRSDSPSILAPVSVSIPSP